MTPQPQTPQPEPVTLPAVTSPVTPAPRVPLNEMLALVRDTELINAYGREIIESQLAINRFDQQWRLARVFAESGMFADAQQINQAMAKIQIGESWKMNPADAMQFIDVFTGRPSVRNEYLAAKMRDGGLDWDIEWHRDDKGVCIGCTLWPRRLNASGQWEDITERKDGQKIHASVSFTRAHAEKVKVKEDGKWITLAEKATYQAYPEDLYFSKAIARLKRRYASNILSGVIMRDEVDEIAPPPVAAPKEKLEVVETITSGRQSRKKAGREDIPGTTVELAMGDAPVGAIPTPRADGLVPGIAVEVSGGAAPIQTAKPATDDPVTPWRDQAAMIAAFRAENVRLGAARFQAELRLFEKTYPKYMIGNASFSDPVTAVFYRQLVAVVIDPAPPVADGVEKLFG